MVCCTLLLQEELARAQGELEAEMQRALDELRNKERARYEKERSELELLLKEEAARSHAEHQAKLQSMRR
jgi:hypothetical protein